MTRIAVLCLLLVSVSFSQKECFGNVSEIEKIAVHFTEMILSGDTEDIPATFSMSDEMKAIFLKTNSFKEWTNAILKRYGSTIERENVKTTLEYNNYHTYIQYKFKNGQMTFEVLISQQNQQKMIYGFIWDNDNEQLDDSAEWTIMIFMFLSIFVVLPLVIFLIIFFGEKWRMNYLHNSEIMEKYIDISVVYRESQNPLWPYVLLLTICFFHGLGYAVVFFSKSGISIDDVFGLGIGLILILVVGLICGFFVKVCDEKLVIRMGLIGLNVLSVPLEDIKSVEVVTFSPFGDFGGWGIRIGGKDTDWAYFMSGGRGVKIVTKKNKKYLIGSDTPNLLRKIIQEKCHIEQTDN